MNSALVALGKVPDQALDLRIAVALRVLTLIPEVLDVAEPFDVNHSGRQKGADTQLKVVSDVDIRAMAACSRIGLTSPGSNVVGHAHNVSNGLGVDLWVVHHEILPALIRLKPVGSEVEGKGFTVGGVRAALKHFSTVAVGEASIGELAERLNDIPEAMVGQLIVVIKFNEKLAPRKTAATALHLTDNSAVAISAEQADTTVIARQRGDDVEGFVIGPRIVQNNPLPIRVGLSEQRGVGPSDPVTRAVCGSEHRYQRGGGSSRRIDDAKVARHHLISDAGKINGIAVDVDPAPPHFKGHTREHREVLEGSERDDDVNVTRGQRPGEVHFGLQRKDVKPIGFNVPDRPKPEFLGKIAPTMAKGHDRQEFTQRMVKLL